LWERIKVRGNSEGERQLIKWYPVAKTEMIPVREGRKVVYGKTEVALFNLGNKEFMAVGNRCPHKAGPLADGIVAGKTVFCPLHNLNLSLENGCALRGESGQVKVYPTKIVEDKVYIAFENGKLCEPKEGEVQGSSSQKALGELD
jgi:nitrite reductase (NADH) small subunit